MPHLHLSLSPAPGNDTDLHALARTLTRLTAQHLDKDASLTSVRIDVLAPTQWFIATRSLAELRCAAYQFEVQVTAGTNSEAQIDAYLAAVHGTMALAFDELHPTSYAVVQQLPAASWGYGGKTQAARRIERERVEAA